MFCQKTNFSLQCFRLAKFHFLGAKTANRRYNDIGTLSQSFFQVNSRTKIPICDSRYNLGSI